MRPWSPLGGAMDELPSGDSHRRIRSSSTTRGSWEPASRPHRSISADVRRRRHCAGLGSGRGGAVPPASSACGPSRECEGHTRSPRGSDTGREPHGGITKLGCSSLGWRYGGPCRSSPSSRRGVAERVLEHRPRAHRDSRRKGRSPLGEGDRRAVGRSLRMSQPADGHALESGWVAASRV